jgi:Flp pilus assembly protein TadB
VRQFAAQLPDGLLLVIGSLRSGFSLSQSLESLVRESPEPLAAEVGRRSPSIASARTFPRRSTARPAEPE